LFDFEFFDAFAECRAGDAQQFGGVDLDIEPDGTPAGTVSFE